jgi:hypothetical protein
MLRRSGGSDLPLLPVLDVLIGTGVADPTRLAVLRLRLAQILSAAAMTFGWESADAARWSRWDIETDTGLRPNLGCLPLRTNDAIILSIVPGRQFKMSERALAVWALCQGETAAEIAARAVAALAGSRLETDQDTVEKLVTKFVELGVVHAAK